MLILHAVFPKISRSNAGDLLEHPIKMRQMIVTDEHADFSNVKIRILQQIHRIADPHFIQIFDKWFV